MNSLTRRLFLSLLSAAVLSGWIHGSQPGGQNVIDDLGNLVIDDLGNQVVTS